METRSLQKEVPSLPSLPRLSPTAACSPRRPDSHLAATAPPCTLRRLPPHPLRVSRGPALPMSPSAAARAWRRFLRGSPWRGASAARQASTASASGVAEEAASAPKKVPPPPRKGRLLTGAMIGLAIAGGAFVSTADEAKFCGWLFKSTQLVDPLFALLDAEFDHCLAVSAAAHGFVPREKRPDPPVLGLEVWGRKFTNPIGLAAGFNKNAEAVEGLLGMGFGFVEVGSVTPLPQEGNPKPRRYSDYESMGL